MRKLTALVLTVSMLMLSVVPVYADFTVTDSSNLSSIKSSVNSGGALYTLVNSIKNAYGSSTSSGTVLYYLSKMYNTLCTTNNNTTLLYYIQSMSSSLKHSNVSAAEYLSRIWNKLPSYGDMALSIASIVRMDSTLSELYNVIIDGGVIPQQLIDDVSTISGHSQVHTQQFFNIDSTLSSLNSRFDTFRTAFLGRGTAYPFSIRYVDWDDNLPYTNVYGSFSETLFDSFQYIQNPLARLAYVHASDEEIQIRENASTAQTEFDTNFLDDNGLGRIPDSSYGDIASISSQFTSNFSTGANPSAIFNVFDSSNWGWFSQDTANSLDTTPRTRSSSYFPTPNLDAQIEAIYSLLGGE